MKEIDAALKAVADGLRSIAQGVGKLAEKLEIAPNGQAKRKANPARKAKTKASAQVKAKAGRKVKKAPAKKNVKPDTATLVVLNVISRSKNGVDTATLAEKTEFDKKKLANIIFRLRKQGKIKPLKRGVYTKA